MFKLQTKQPNGKWIALGAWHFKTLETAWAAAASYDQDGFVHSALWRVIGPGGAIHTLPKLGTRTIKAESDFKPSSYAGDATYGD